eukprot:maker-scaffold203_size261420-snap-gene-0.9 protein:Tk10407 transcript:maker-scaffold203_size261420-snap-gene-0.9-mRNA-1 annotation:"hypothetical protein"
MFLRVRNPTLFGQDMVETKVGFLTLMSWANMIWNMELDGNNHGLVGKSRHRNIVRDNTQSQCNVVQGFSSLRSYGRFEFPEGDVIISSNIASSLANCTALCAPLKKCNIAAWDTINRVCVLLSSFSLETDSITTEPGTKWEVDQVIFCERDSENYHVLYRSSTPILPDYSPEEVYREFLVERGESCILMTFLGEGFTDVFLFEDNTCLMLKRSTFSAVPGSNQSKNVSAAFMGLYQVKKSVIPDMCDRNDSRLVDVTEEDYFLDKYSQQEYVCDAIQGCWNPDNGCSIFALRSVVEGSDNCTSTPTMVEEIQYKDEERCIHINQEACSQTYQTVFKTSKIQDCKETFVKDCFIEYESVPKSQKIQICKEPLIRDCEIEGEETCSTEFETICETTFHEAKVEDEWPCGQRHQCRIEQVESTKLIPETDCHQKNMTVCGSESCPIVKGERVCTDELKTFVEEVPKERCHLNPKKTCNEVNKVIPKLELTTECIDVPKELCETIQVAAERVQVQVNRTPLPWFGGLENSPPSRIESKAARVESKAARIESKAARIESKAARIEASPMGLGLEAPVLSCVHEREMAVFSLVASVPSIAPSSRPD